MSPLESLIKNIVLIILLLFIRRQKGIKIRFQRIIIVTLAVLCLVTTFIYSPPDFIIQGRYQGNTQIANGDDNIYFNQLITEHNYQEGKQILCFFSTRCKYCKLASQKISVMAKDINEDVSISYIFFGKKVFLEDFWHENTATRYPWIMIPVKHFFRITNGEFPLIVFLEDGKVAKTFGYRDLTEKALQEFVQE